MLLASSKHYRAREDARESATAMLAAAQGRKKTHSQASVLEGKEEYVETMRHRKGTTNDMKRGPDSGSQYGIYRRVINTVERKAEE